MFHAAAINTSTLPLPFPLKHSAPYQFPPDAVPAIESLRPRHEPVPRRLMITRYKEKIYGMTFSCVRTFMPFVSTSEAHEELYGPK